MTWLVLLLLLVVGAAPFVMERSRRAMDDSARNLAPGQFATLPQGVTHYSWQGPVDGPILICVHGLTTPSFVWGGLLRGLTLMGFRVLTYDLFGRGYSDRPRGQQDAAFFNRQLSDLMADQQVEGKVTLFGYSMGGAIVTCFAATHPDRVRQVILLAPAGMHHHIGKLASFMRNWRGAGDWLMLAFFPRTHRQGIAAEAHLASSVPDICELQAAELTFRGFVPAVLASLRGLLSRDLQPDHAAIKAAGIPTLAIWGRDDAVIPISAMDTLAKWNPDVTQEVIEGAGHALAYTHSDRIIKLLESRLLQK